MNPISEQDEKWDKLYVSMKEYAEKIKEIIKLYYPSATFHEPGKNSKK
jgi:hypothetical protein